MTEPRTLPRLLETSADRFPNNPLMWEKRTDTYEPTTYAQMRERIHAFGAGLMSLGLNKGDRAALISEGRNDWVMSEMGILYCGAINVPISIKLDEPSDLKFRLSHSGCRFVIVSQGQVEKIRKIKNDLPELEKVIVLDELRSFESDEIWAGDILRAGSALAPAAREAFDDRWKSVQESDYANICYTSGTTADPKGIILTHRNYTANCEQSLDLVRCEEDWVCLIILPWDHAFAHTCAVYTLMMRGASMASIQTGQTGLETLRNIPINIKETRPHILLSVPALAKNFRKNIEKGVREKGPKVQGLFRKALKTAIEYNGEGWNRGRGVQALKKPLFLLYDKVLFRKIRENFGGRLKFFVGGGALLDIDLQRFFYAIGIPMFQGYGLTEAAPVVSANSGAAHKLGSSGRIATGIELRICDSSGTPLPVGGRGEIVIRGENVMAGYWKNDKATRETIKNGWLYTGDLGYLDEDGFLYVLGRTKSLLIANDGEKYSPESIEEALTEGSPYVEQFMLYNNQSPCTVGLLVPNKEAILSWLKKSGLSARTPEGQAAALKLLDGEIAKYREGGSLSGLFPARWLPATAAVLGEGFTEQNHLMNSTMKIVRGKIEEFYRARLDYLFTPEGKTIDNPQNRTIIARFE
ncbi:MAG: AMP-binding protein [Candidatus Aminicenantes bacterium]|nr:AMP-binding protein [Candidatus Aminicenantes bacterium]